LIELLVVVAIIALLISILLPSLSEAKEQAKIAKCLANMKGLMTTTILYFTDYNDEFPFFVTTGEGGGTGICTWSYGGKTSSDWWRTEYGGAFFVPVQTRPFNLYLLGNTPDPDLREGNTIIKRTEIPVLECPSDTRSFQRVYDTSGQSQPNDISAYEDIGTSYHYNLHAIEGVRWGRQGDNPWASPGSWADRGRVLVRDVHGIGAGTFVLFVEDPMDYALKDNTHQIGNHGKVDRYSGGFLDGHAEHRIMDTTNWCGPGWSTINMNWTSRLGERMPSIRYTDLGKNCDY